MQFVVSNQQDGLMLSIVLRQEAPSVPIWAIKEAMKKRDVRIDGCRIDKDVRVYSGQMIKVFFPKSAVTEREKKELPFPQIVYEDEYVVLMNKPQGIPSLNEDSPMEGDTALTRMAAYLKASGFDVQNLHLCHRLDVQTGGLLMFVKGDEAFEDAKEAFSRRTMQKYYTCRVKGCPAKHEAHMMAYLRKDAEISRVAITDYPARGAMPIETAYRVIESGEYAKLEVELITGRTHQIRAHLAHIGHPIIGDDKYGDRSLNRKLSIRKQQLWATRLVFYTEGVLSYLNGRVFTVECPF